MMIPPTVEHECSDVVSRSHDGLDFARSTPQLNLLVDYFNRNDKQPIFTICSAQAKQGSSSRRKGELDVLPVLGVSNLLPVTGEALCTCLLYTSRCV